MEQFTTMAAEKLGVDVAMVESAIGVVLGLVKDNASSGDFQNLLYKLPGADALLGQTGVGASSGGGLMGAAVSALGGAIGGGSTLGGLAELKETGLDSGQLGSLLEMFKGYATEAAGGDLVAQVLGRVPGLKELTG